MEKKQRLLILGGAYLHNKVVLAAKKMGIYTIVTDNVPDAPAKKLADKAYDINVSDVDAIVEMCRMEHVTGVLTVCLDFCQVYYQQICQKLGLPCYGTEEQFRILTRKNLFKKVCQENGVDIIPSYELHEVTEQQLPVLVKPSSNRGSRGQTVCKEMSQLMPAVQLARESSEDGKAVIEKYMGDADDFQVTYLVADGVPYVVRTADRYLGDRREGMGNVAIALSSPSSHTKDYLEKAHPNVCRMLRSLGIKNGPFFMQGFVDGDAFRFYDPGLRFPGGDYDRIFALVMGTDLMELLVKLAFSGSVPSDPVLNERTAYLNGHVIFTLHETVGPGEIAHITPKEKILEIPGVCFMSFRHKEGDRIALWGDVRQRLAEINIHAETADQLRQTVQCVEDSLHAENAEGNDLVFCKFDIANWRICE